MGVKKKFTFLKIKIKNAAKTQRYKHLYFKIILANSGRHPYLFPRAPYHDGIILPAGRL